MNGKDTNKVAKYIGKVVTLKSNHLKSAQHFESIWLAGEPNYISPLMIIKEVLIVKSDKIDEDSGEIRNSKGEYQFKCIWFSNKSFKIEEGWFYEKELLNIESKDFNQPVLKFGDNVVLKTNRLELEKRKTYLESDRENSQNKVSALLNFCSPVFIFLGYAPIEKKEPVIDPNTGLLKREYCSKLVKLKSFNVKEDKYSEFLIPVEAIEKIEIINEKIFQKYFDAREDKSFIVSFNQENQKKKIIDKIYSVNSISAISNIYKAEIKHIFSNENEAIEIENLDLDIIKDIENDSKYPQIHKIKKEFKINSIEDYLREILENNDYCEEDNIDENYVTNLKTRKLIKIVYKNKFEKVTTRFCIPIFFFPVITKRYSQKEEKEVSNTEYYIQSFCLYRNDYRNFKTERILSLELIENKMLNDFAFQTWTAAINN